MGDRSALEASRLFAKLPKGLPIAEPDSVAKPFDRLRKAKPDYGKIAGAQAKAPHLDLDNSSSMSLRQTIAAIRQLITNEDQ